MLGKKSVIFIEKLDYLNISLVIIFFLLKYKIYYRTININLKKNLFFKKFLIIKFRRLQYLDNEQARFILNKSFKEKSLFLDQFTSEILNDDLFKILSKEKNFINHNLSRLKICFYESFQNALFNLEYTSYSLISINFLEKNINVIYLPNNLQSFLYLNKKNNSQIKVFVFHVILKNILNILFKKIPRFFFRRFKSILTIKKKININKKFNNDDMYLMYSPHGNSFKYINAFKKNFIYNKEPSSKIYFKKIITVWFENKIQKETKRYLDIYNLPYTFYSKGPIRKLFSFFLILKIFLIFLNTFTKSEISQNIIKKYIILKTIINVINARKFLKNYKNLKYVYAYYDNIFSRSFLYAANSLGIKTISHQERSASYLWSIPLIYDHYFLNGKGFKDLYISRGSKIDNYHTYGVIRSGLIAPKKNSEFSDKMKLLKQNKKIILCAFLYLQPQDEENLSIFGCNGYSKEANISFINSIIGLSEKFEDCYFLISSKENNPEFIIKKNYPEIDLSDIKSKNINFLSNFKTNSYEAAFYADLVIGKQTNLMEEVLSTKRKVLFFDSENYVSKMNYPLNNDKIIVKNLPELKNFVEKYLYKKENYFDKKINDLIHNYLNESNNITSYKTFLKSLELILKN